MNPFSFLARKASHFRSLYRAYKGRCPYCGKDLELKKRTGKPLIRFLKSCPDGHFGVEYHGDGRVTYHDKEGDPIALLHDRNFRLIKGDKKHGDT